MKNREITVSKEANGKIQYNHHRAEQPRYQRKMQRPEAWERQSFRCF